MSRAGEEGKAREKGVANRKGRVGEGGGKAWDRKERRAG